MMSEAEKKIFKNLGNQTFVKVVFYGKVNRPERIYNSHYGNGVPTIFTS